MLNVKQKILEDLKRAIKNLTGEDIVPTLEHPKDERHGDYSTNVAMIIFQKSEIRNPKSETNPKSKIRKYKTPLDLALEIVNKLEVHPPASEFARRRSRAGSSKFRVLEKVEAVAPGFVNFYLSEKYLLDNIKTVLEEKEKFGSKEEDPNKKVVVEYSSPNISKPFTVGHLRSTIIGDAIANLLEANGWKVYRDNHLGDWGTQFGKQIYAIKKWGNEDEINKSENRVKMLVDLYVKFHQESEKDPALEEEGRKWFKKLEDGDKEARRLWNKCIEWSLKEFQKIYDQLGIKFTENNGIGYGESFFEDKMIGVIKELEDKGLLKESEGAKLVFFEKDPSASFDSAQDMSSGQAKYPPLMILKKDGATLYATRDLATDRFRLNKYGKDILIINEVGIEQSLYFKQIFEVEKMLGWVKDGQRIHKRHGHYRFKDEKMSTRKGNVIWLEEVLEEAKRRAYKLSSIEVRNTSKEVAIGAIKWNDLKRTSEQDIVFDWDEILNMQGDSGPYIQYTFARTQSVLAKVKSQKSKVKTTNVILGSADVSRSDSRISMVQRDSGQARMTPEELSLLRTFHRFPEIVGEAAGNFAPNILCNYLFDLSQKFNLFYQKHKILNVVIPTKRKRVEGYLSSNFGKRDSSPAVLVQNDNVQDFRLALTQAVGQVIKNGLDLLGIQAPERM